jgi:hypothetical protein
VPTDPKRQFELLFRFYGPKKELFEKTGVLPDIEEARLGAQLQVGFQGSSSALISGKVGRFGVPLTCI